MEERLKFDNNILQFFLKNKVFFLLLIPILLSLFLRLQPVNLPITDDWAKQSVYGNIKQQIFIEVDKQYPNLPSSKKNEIVNTEFDKALFNNKDYINEQIKQTSEYFKSRMQDDTGQTYLLAIDPYAYLKATKNVIEYGQMGNTIKDGKNWDSFIIAPLGIEVADSSFHVVVEYYLYKFVSFFNKDVSLMSVIFYLPVLICMLAIIPAFFIAKKKAGNFAGFVSAFIVGVSTALLSRTPAGFSDTDGWNVFFPLFIVWFFLFAFDSDKVWKKYLFISLSASIVGLYSLTWPGWWFVFDFVLFVFVAYIIYLVYEYLKDTRQGIQSDTKLLYHSSILLFVFLVVSILCVNFIFFKNGLQHALWGGPTSFLKLKEIGISTIWPNVFTTVAEQNASTIKDVIYQIGGKFLLILSIIGIILMFYKKDKNNMFDIKYCLLITVWFLATMFASVRGIRYILLLVPAFGIALGIFYGITYDNIIKYINKENISNKFLINCFVIFALLSLLFIPRNLLMESYLTSKNEIPSINDAWYESLEKINIESDSNAIITSWWDFGHWFKAIANRGVTFDGGSQNTPMAHWVGRMFLTSDENESLGILRMLDCGSYIGEKILYNHTNNSLESINIIKTIILQNKLQAKQTLLHHVNDTQADIILKYTHCNPPEAYVITSTDMVGKSGVWAHFGQWDFKKATIYNKLINKKITPSLEYLKKTFNYTEEESVKLFYEVNSPNTNPDTWIANWPNYEINSPELKDSLFTKLYFQDGNNTKYFKKFSDITSFNGQRVIVWKVDWNKFLN